MQEVEPDFHGRPSRTVQHFHRTAAVAKGKGKGKGGRGERVAPSVDEKVKGSRCVCVSCTGVTGAASSAALFAVASATCVFFINNN
ncbi:hypothetical protein K0M31_008009 [Melipona bicolor]|uniref:Uncharacterized protein n=1 Tax=Melipona bicolor TaxID=60889 RepID=A0AA40KWJ8_9HYME|nr:hypothetical protein K0M31_008009 [Melipona bicolor]